MPRARTHSIAPPGRQHAASPVNLRKMHPSCDVVAILERRVVRVRVEHGRRELLRVLRAKARDPRTARSQRTFRPSRGRACSASRGKGTMPMREESRTTGASDRSRKKSPSGGASLAALPMRSITWSRFEIQPGCVASAVACGSARVFARSAGEGMTDLVKDTASLLWLETFFSSGWASSVALQKCHARQEQARPP